MKARVLNGGVTIENSASPKKPPKRPRASTSSIVRRPMVSKGRTTAGTAGSAIEGALVHPESPEGEIFRVEVVLQHEDPREAGAVPERIVPAAIGALAVEQMADAALDDVGAGPTRREERKQCPRRLARRRRSPSGQARVVVALARLAPAVVGVLVGVQPPHCAVAGL